MKLTIDKLTNLVIEALQGGALFTNTGGAHTNTGTSSWSSAKNNMTDEDEEGQGLWQNQLTNLNFQYGK